MGKKAKRPPKKVKRRMLPPVWLDDDDQKAVERLQEILWARTKQDALLQALRWAVIRIAEHPNAHRRFLRESERAFADGRCLTVRLTEEQREYLYGFVETVRADSATEAVRIIIRMAKDYFEKH